MNDNSNLIYEKKTPKNTDNRPELFVVGHKNKSKKTNNKTL